MVPALVSSIKPITDAKAVSELRDFHVIGSIDEWPLLRGFFPVRGEPAEPASRATHNLRFAVAGDVGEDGRFVVHHIGDEVHGPWFVVVRAGIQIQPRFLAGEAEDEDVVPFVGVEIVDVGEEVVGVAIDRKNLRLVVGVLLFKSRSFPPKRPRDDIRFAVAIDVADGGTLGVKVTVELLTLPGDLRGGMQAGGREEGKKDRFHGNPQNTQISPI